MQHLQLFIWSAPVVIALVLSAIYQFAVHRARNSVSSNGEDPPQISEKLSPPHAHTSTYGPEKSATPIPRGGLLAAIPEAIKKSDEDTIERGDWVIRIAKYIHNNCYGCLYNVVVVNNDIEYRLSARDIVEDFVLKYYETSRGRVVPYRMVVFKTGGLINLGDGGYINWCGVGNITRLSGKTMRFDACSGSG